MTTTEPSPLKPGDHVRVKDECDARLQIGLSGVVLHPGNAHWASDIPQIRNRAWLLIDLTPNGEGLFGGMYWFPPEDLEVV